MKKIKKLNIINIILILISTFILIWIINLHGLSGLCRWNPKYKKIIYLLLFLNILIISIFAFSFVSFKNKKIVKAIKIISITLSSIICLSFISLFLYFTIPVISKTDNKYILNEVNIENDLKLQEPLLSLAVSSDPHWGSENSNKEARDEILKNIGLANYDAFLCLGDVAEIGSSESFYQLAANDFEKFLNNTPLHVVLGNHDALINGTGVFKKYFQKKQDNFYNQIDYDNLHIITLDLLWDAKEFDKTQEQWLISQLEDIKREDITIVLSHCYGYCSGYEDLETSLKWYDNKDVIEKVTPIIEKYDVELMLSGHNHLMELLKNKNTYYGIIGTMGGILDRKSDYISPQSIWLNNEDFGWLDIQVYSNYLELTYKNYKGENLYTTVVENN